MSSPSRQTRASYRAIELYSPDRSPCPVDVSDNTNLWGIPPAAERAVREAAVATVTRYPPLYTAELKNALAAYTGVTPGQIVTGCGSDDVLDSAIRAFCEPGDRIAYPDPGFAMIPIFARMNGVEPVAVPLLGGTRLDPYAMLAARARVIYLCSPNNPTGNALDPVAVRRVVEESTGIVIVDEAYAEFAPWNALAMIAHSERLLVTRTLSKAFGLAGLRVGYAVGADALVAEVEKSRGPYKVNGVAERAALMAVTSDLGWVRSHIALAVDNRERLSASLRTLGLAPLYSDANFVLVPVRGASALARVMRDDGVAVRPFTELPEIGDALRISIGPWDMMEEVLAALISALARESGAAAGQLNHVAPAEL